MSFALSTRSLPQITRPAFRYFGGKWLLGPWIWSYFPDHDCYVEPFGGAFSVGLQKPPAANDIYNDLHQAGVNFFQVLQQQPDSLLEAIAQSPRTAAEFQCCLQPCDQPLEWARRYYLYCQLAYIGGGGRWSHGLSSSRLQASSSWDVGHLTAIADRIQTVQFLNLDAFNCIQIYDSPSTLFYCDPPYPHSARGSKDKRHQNPVTPRRQYRHEMTDEDHRQLAEILHGIQGRAIISGYACLLYEELYSDWKRVEQKAFTTSGVKRVECLWLSPEPPQIVQVKLSPKPFSLTQKISAIPEAYTRK
ncbi:DNA adenine methylase [Acaryochloris marina]|uniref:D12 class N6 adenine-specific DNA methyltransferase n=1 Tax=Acaryochloris marina (strain MBIC 11017) TaxID=329726 RepID=B0C0M1_ACAM1|nr:DNA adenine methylase [Acaryochloris marina]ABW30814.1 D12 class N6 adenine-specific DNA methyltransferase [Acaryochloris marina MBIC11017]BDM79565.1 DNA methyltransferase [Acaryochloris marina MBIC10699]